MKTELTLPLTIVIEGRTLLDIRTQDEYELIAAAILLACEVPFSRRKLTCGDYDECYLDDSHTGVPIESCSSFEQKEEK